MNFEKPVHSVIKFELNETNTDNSKRNITEIINEIENTIRQTTAEITSLIRDAKIKK